MHRHNIHIHTAPKTELNSPGAVAMPLFGQHSQQMCYSETAPSDLRGKIQSSPPCKVQTQGIQKLLLTSMLFAPNGMLQVLHTSEKYLVPPSLSPKRYCTVHHGFMRYITLL